jgi:hypothetical protein
LLVLGEVDFLRHNTAAAETHLSQACRTNPKAVGGFFLRSYVAWKRDDTSTAKDLLRQMREALGKDWQPKGSTSEGDVRQKWHLEKTPLSRFWENWDGNTDLPQVFAALDRDLTKR